MNRFVLLCIVAFATIFVCYVSYIPASDYQLRSAIEDLTDSIEDLNSNVKTLNEKIGDRTTVFSLIYEIDDLKDDIETLGSEISSLESTIRRK